MAIKVYYNLIITKYLKGDLKVNREIIQSSIDYIEDNLKTEIIPMELSKMTGFSLFHYYRLFLNAVGMPVMQFVLRRKLLNAIYEISCGNKMIEVALTYGFETYAGFYKAFLREFGYTPTQFLKKYKVKKPHKINILEEEHIMITHKKIKEILKNWGLENEIITDIIYEETGERSDAACYVGSDYVMKYSANLGKIETNISISQALENVGLSVASPIKTVDGRDYITDGELYFCLTKRVKGRQLKASSMYIDEYVSKARYIGEVIGQLSIALVNVKALVNDVNIYEDVIKWALPNLKDKIKIEDGFFDEYAKIFGSLYEMLPKQIIHRDPNPGNIIMNDDNWGFIDFELSEYNIRIYDPCYAATAILSESFEEDDEKLNKWVEVYKNIIYGYDDVAKLTEEEKRAVPYVIIAIQMITTAWFSEYEKYEELFEINIKMTKWIADNFEKLVINER